MMVRSTRWLRVLALSAAVLAAACTRQTAPAADLGTDIDRAAATLIAQPLLHSTSIAVVYRGQEFIRHAGAMETGKPGNPSDTTVYEIGSLSKTLAGTLVANAVLEHQLDLDDDVRQYLPGDYPNLQYHGQPIRIRHLLTHTSGLPNMLPERANTVLADFLDHRVPHELDRLYAHYAKADFLNDLHTVQIEHAPGKDYAYSSAGTQLVAQVLEQVYGTDYETLLRRYFQQAAGITGFRIQLDDAEAARLAVGYHSDNPVPTTPMPPLPWGASGNVKATVPDMLKYLRFQLAAGPVVTESHRTLATFDPDFSIGYFWNIVGGDAAKGRYYGHHGGVPRSQCYVYIIPKYDLGIFIITNQSGEQTARAMETAVDTLVAGIVTREKATPER